MLRGDLPLTESYYMMDFGAVGLEGLACPDNRICSQVVSNPDQATTTKSNNGSGFLKQPRSGSLEDDWTSSKLARTDDSDSSKTMLYPQGIPMLLRSNSLISGDAAAQHPTMLSFSSPSSSTSSRSEVAFLSRNGGLAAERSNQNVAPPYFQHTPYGFSRNAGYSSGGLNAGGTHAPILGARGQFTPSQWVELEHQALIYKFIISNVPVPANLLIPLKKSLDPYGFYGLSSGGSYVPNPYAVGAGSFHLGFSGNTDPEPGRCRRTDGKKWRCSRDAVADQKYCERHINRGRHRSRKPVEGQPGQAVAGSVTTKVALPPPLPTACSASASSVRSSSRASNSPGITQHQFKGLPPSAENPSAEALVHRRMQNPQSLSVVSPITNLKAKDSPFSIPKQHLPIEESSHSEFGLLSSDSLFNSPHKSSSSFMDSRNYDCILDFNDHESHDQHPLRHFIDDWPKDQSNSAAIAWPEELRSDWTQLSMSIPMAASDFSSNSSSSPQEKIALSPLRLCRELEPVQKDLAAVRNELSESTQKQPNWVPISWGSSMGGPLGEALNSTSPALNFTTRAWNNNGGSPQLGSSPTGVLQKTTFVSLSNSSSGSSSRDHKKTTNESSGDYMLGSTLASSFSIPSL